MFEWLRRLSLIGKIAGIVGAIAVSITATAAAWPLVEPLIPVTRGELRLVMDKQAIATDRQTLFQLQEYLDRATKDPAATTSPIVRQRIDELKNQIDQMQARIRKATGG